MKSVKQMLAEQGYTDIKKKVLLSLIILVAIIVASIVIIFLYYPKSCEDPECFAKALNNCKRVSLVKEDAKAVWYYEIIGRAKGEDCNVKVRLLKMKQGTIDVEYLEGEEMTCIVQKGETFFPEENMESCTGLLKEELQGLIIEKMHSYILKNIGEIKENFKV